MSSNKHIKEIMIKKYGKECWIDKLQLRPPEDHPRKYKSKNQLKRMKQLTYHHIKPKSKGGKATIENGAILSAENHEWFHKQSPQMQRQLNALFQEYKHQIDYGTFISDAKIRQEQIQASKAIYRRLHNVLRGQKQVVYDMAKLDGTNLYVQHDIKIIEKLEAYLTELETPLTQEQMNRIEREEMGYTLDL